MDAYLAEHYELAGFADMSDKRYTVYRWDGQGQPRGERFIKVFQRRELFCKP